MVCLRGIGIRPVEALEDRLDMDNILREGTLDEREYSLGVSHIYFLLTLAPACIVKSDLCLLKLLEFL